MIHLHASISLGFPYDREEARIFLDSILPSAPDVVVQIAHLAGSGGYGAPATDAALSILAEAVEKKDPRAARLYFDVSGVITPDITPAQASLVVRRIRQIGADRIFYGSDVATGGNLHPREAWAAFRRLPLTNAEIKTIAGNIPPYVR